MPLLRRSIRCIPTVLLLANCLLTLARASAQLPKDARPSAFAPVKLGIGWVISEGRLFWTNDNGLSWTEITPKGSSSGALIGNAFFRDQLHGYAAMVKGFDNDRQPVLQIASTSNGGASWVLSSIDSSKVSMDPSIPPAVGDITFADGLHGWTLFNTSQNTASRSALLAATTDGGKSWTLLPRPPIDGEISFSSATNGILTTTGAVWFTHNGGYSWVPASLPVPKDCPKCMAWELGHASFANRSDAVLAGTVRSPGRDGESAVEYQTANAGTTWTLRKSPSPSNPTELGGWGETGGHLIRIGSQSDGSLVFEIDGAKTPLRLPASKEPWNITQVRVASDFTTWFLYDVFEVPHELLSIDPVKGTVKVLNPTASDQQ